jgi:hypothetical protein
MDIMKALQAKGKVTAIACALDVDEPKRTLASPPSCPPFLAECRTRLRFTQMVGPDWRTHSAKWARRAAPVTEAEMHQTTY